jgi:hypothetical protein
MLRIRAVIRAEAQESILVRGDEAIRDLLREPPVSGLRKPMVL